jgi:hypothetical protein
MKLTSVSLALAAACVFVQSAQAHGYHHRYGYRQHASRHVLSQRYLEQSGYGSGEMAGGQSWHQNWQQWPSGSWDDNSWGGHRRNAGAERSEYGGYAESGFSERRRFLRRHMARYDERGEGHDGFSHYAERTDYRGGYGSRPAAWCGWEMRHLVGGDPGPRYNLARNWSHWGHSGPAGVGAVVVWPHHVGKIVGREDGEWVVESGNDGHRLRTRPRSIGGAIAIRWG